MRSMLAMATLGLVTLLGFGAAQADEGRHGPGPRPEARRVHRENHRHPGRRVERVWVACPRYERRIVSYDHCGQPIYKSVCVSEGYWSYRHCD